MAPSSGIDGEFDYIVVGGGSAGCIMAARLSEKPSSRVLLVESGKDFAPGSEPRAMRDPAAPIFFNADYFEPMMGEGASTGPGKPGVAIPIPQARVIGGGSSVNGMHAQRGETGDYDEWRQLGVTGWSWDEVLPYFKKVETDLDFEGPAHGSSGPIKIKRHGRESWSKLTVTAARLLERQGVPGVADINDYDGACYGSVPLNATSERMSSASAYLTAQVRSRPNLRILSETKVARVVFDGKRVRGVELSGDANIVILGANVVVSCGAFLSPELLLRSGIGPGRALREAGIDIVADRPGIGENLQCHPLVNVFAHLARAGRSNGRARAPCLMIARLSSDLPGCPPSDLIFNLWERSPGSTVDNPLHRQFADFMLVLNKAYSVGTVTLDPADPKGAVRVRTNLLSDPRDLARMANGFHFLAKLALAGDFKGMINDVFAMKPDPAALKMFEDSLKMRAIGTIGAMVLGGPDKLRRAMLKNAIIPIRDLIADRSTLEAHVRADSQAAHASGTCRLGDPQAPSTVVDEHCRVVGVEGLRVVDASIFPRSMRAGTNLPTMMAAEKAAESIRAGH